MKITVVGSYGVGLTMRVPRAPLAGETVSSGVFAEGPGGKGSNQAICAARLGATVSFLTAVGDDDYGKAARRLWEREGVDAAKTVVSSDAATMVGFILVEPSGENRIAIAPGALDTLDAAAVESFRPEIASADILVVSMEIPLPAVVAALRIGKESGTRTLLNPAPAQPLPPEAWPLIDVLTPNQTEARILLGQTPADTADDSELAELLAARTGGAVIITRGSRGSLVVDAGQLLAVEPVRAERVVDTTGAGDSFTAALAVALAEGRTLAEATRFASFAGAHTVTVEGVIPALPTRDDINAEIGATR